MNNNQNQYVRRFRRKSSNGKGTVVVIVLLSVVVLLAFSVLILALTGKLDPLLDRFFGSKDPKGPSESTVTVAQTETAEPTGTAEETSPFGTEPQQTSVPETDPPLINDGEIQWEFVSLEYNASESGMLVLIDSDHPYTFPKKSGVELTNVYAMKGRKYSMRNSSIELDKTAAQQFNAMVDAFYAATGHRDLMLFGGYRDYAYQESLYQPGGTAFAPGCTDYHSGTSLYVKIYGEDGIMRELDSVGGDYAWVANHAHEYGFVCRYPVGKEGYTGTLIDGRGHYRYVGPAHAALMHEKNFCLEEYYEYLEDFTYTGNHLTTMAGGHEYEIFCVPMMADGITKVPVPNNFPYTLSGDNRGNVIVTVER